MDAGTMKSDITTVLRDTGGGAFPAADLLRWLNEAQRDLAVRLKNLHKESTGVMPSNGKITLSDMVEADWVLITGDAEHVEFTDDDTFQYYKETASTPSIRLARVLGDDIEFYPVVATGTAYTVRYAYTPTDLVADPDVSAHPAHLHIKMVNFGRAHAKYKDGAMAEGDRYMQMYEQSLPPPSLGRAKMIPGPITLKIDPSPFDEPDAAHI